jgi:transposase
VHPEEVAATLGLRRSTVYGWLAKFREGGWDVLRAKPVPGRPPKLSATQMGRLYALIVGADPRQLSFGFALWTREMVREVIRREFAVSLSAVSVGRLLRTLGLSPRAPAVAGLPAEPGRGRAVEGRDVPRDPRPSEKRRGDGLLPRRGRTALGSPRRHHLGPGRTHPGRGHHRCPPHDQPHLRDHRAGSTPIFHLRGQPQRREVHPSSAESRCTTPPARSTSSWTVTPPTERGPRSGSSPPPTAGCGCSSCPATHPNSTPDEWV